MEKQAETLGKVHVVPVVMDRPRDTEKDEAVSIQLKWLSLPSVKARVKVMGWNGRIHPNSRVTYRDVRDFPRYNWNKWMLADIERGA